MLVIFNLLILIVGSFWVQQFKNSHRNSISEETSKRSDWEVFVGFVEHVTDPPFFYEAGIQDGKLIFTAYMGILGYKLGYQKIITIDVDSGKVHSFTLDGFEYGNFRYIPEYLDGKFVGLETEGGETFSLFNINDGTEKVLLHHELLGDPIVLFNDALIASQNVWGEQEPEECRTNFCLHINSFSLSNPNETNWSLLFKNYTDEGTLSMTFFDHPSSPLLYFILPAVDSNSEIMKINPTNGDVVFKKPISSKFVTDNAFNSAVLVSTTHEYYYFMINVKVGNDNETYKSCLFGYDQKTDEIVWYLIITEYDYCGDPIGYSNPVLSENGDFIYFICTDISSTSNGLFRVSYDGKIDLKKVIDNDYNFVNVMSDDKLMLLWSSYNDGHTMFLLLDENGKEMKKWGYEKGYLLFRPVFDSSNNVYYCVTRDLFIWADTFCHKRHFKV